MKPKIYRDDFWGDLGNALLLAPPYRRPVKPLIDKANELAAYKEYGRRPKPEPEPRKKVAPVIINAPHMCPFGDWEYDDEGNRVPNQTVVSCPDCGTWWGMDGSNMRELDFVERIQVRIYMKLDSLTKAKKKR